MLGHLREVPLDDRRQRLIEVWPASSFSGEEAQPRPQRGHKESGMVPASTTALVQDHAAQASRLVQPGIGAELRQDPMQQLLKTHRRADGRATVLLHPLPKSSKCLGQCRRWRDGWKGYYASPSKVGHEPSDVAHG